MSTTAPYQFSLSGTEIEKLLKSITEKLDKSAIDTTMEGTSVPSTPTVKAALNEVLKTVTGVDLRKAIQDAPDCNVFTDNYKTLLERGGFLFVGAPADIPKRNAISTTTFQGGETILLQSNEFGVPTVQYWNGTSKKWDDVDEAKAHSFEKTFNGTSKQELIKLPKTKFSIYTFKVMAKTNTNIHMMDLHVGLNYSGNTAWMTGTNDFYGSGKLFTPTVDYDGTNMTLSLTPKASTINVRCEVIAAY
ncbi:hypothetical protein [Vibrio phage VP-1]|uniref:Uncharacterized protein n=1 Tax=Vibrio phage VP-1 TaxID=2234088 RepID=A0A4P2TE96_9CAUD|nr:hypothetical protein [Vibrio phage VP-1]